MTIVRSGHFRVHGRRAVRLHALVTYVQAGWKQQAAVENVGLGGARVLLPDRPPAPEDWVTVSFTTPALWDPVVLHARVAWVAAIRTPHGHAAGVAFEHRSADAAFALFELVAALGYE